MKEDELRSHATCYQCGRKILSAGVPIFWTLTIERHGVLVPAMKRQDGLATFLGSSRLATVMGPGEEMTQTLDGPRKIAICDPCGLENPALWCEKPKSSAQEAT